jgi:hypothetical protein
LEFLGRAYDNDDFALRLALTATLNKGVGTSYVAPQSAMVTLEHIDGAILLLLQTGKLRRRLAWYEVLYCILPVAALALEAARIYHRQESFPLVANFLALGRTHGNDDVALRPAIKASLNKGVENSHVASQSAFETLEHMALIPKWDLRAPGDAVMVDDDGGVALPSPAAPFTAAAWSLSVRPFESATHPDVLQLGGVSDRTPHVPRLSLAAPTVASASAAPALPRILFPGVAAATAPSVGLPVATSPLGQLPES